MDIPGVHITDILQDIRLIEQILFKIAVAPQLAIDDHTSILDATSRAAGIRGLLNFHQARIDAVAIRAGSDAHLAALQNGAAQFGDVA